MGIFDLFRQIESGSGSGLQGKLTWLVVGLGNIGLEYENTRHNAGFMAVEQLAQTCGGDFRQMKFRSDCGEAMVGGVRCLLMKPTTYMNNSGEAVAAAANFYKIPPEHVLVMYDDISLAPGKLRIRRKGSAGGHNGIKSITEHLGTDAYPRFKIGIGHPARNNKAVVNHVLHAFQGDDKTAIEAAVAEMATALEEWIKSGDIEEVMQAHNKKKPKAEKPAAE